MYTEFIMSFPIIITIKHKEHKFIFQFCFESNLIYVNGNFDLIVL